MPADGVTIAVPLRARSERREAERFGAAMPVTVDGQAGTTQDLSVSGLSFLAQQPHAVGARIEVVIEYLLDGCQYPLRCEAEVVRSQAVEGGYKVGARLLPNSVLETVLVESADAVRPAAGVPRPLLRPIE
jgi:hypothetical protein